MIEKKAPEAYAEHLNLPSVFLAGSIEMGVAEDWQEEVARALAGMDVLILNPRRPHWDSSWTQSIDNPAFRQQVDWELDAMNAAGVIAMYFSPATRSPVTMLELGLYAEKNPEKLVVCCQEGFWRKGNVDIVCARHGIARAETLGDMVSMLKARLR